jgi:hypothetical protein
VDGLDGAIHLQRDNGRWRGETGCCAPRAPSTTRCRSPARVFLSFHPFLSDQGRQGRRTGWQWCLVKHVAWTTLTDGLGWAHAYWSFPAFTKSPPAGISSDSHVGCAAGKLRDDYREDIAGAFRRERHCSDWKWNCDLNLMHHCEWSCMTVDAWLPLHVMCPGTDVKQRHTSALRPCYTPTSDLNPRYQRC